MVMGETFQTFGLVSTKLKFPAMLVYVFFFRPKACEGAICDGQSIPHVLSCLDKNEVALHGFGLVLTKFPFAKC